MNIFVKAEAETVAIQVEKDTCVSEVVEVLVAEGYMRENQKLDLAKSAFSADYTMNELGIQDNALIDLAVSLKGGAKDKSLLEPIIVELAKQSYQNKKICRWCYATNAAKATKCRKRKCGHWPDLRLKKERKDKGR